MKKLYRITTILVCLLLALLGFFQSHAAITIVSPTSSSSFDQCTNISFTTNSSTYVGSGIAELYKGSVLIRSAYVYLNQNPVTNTISGSGLAAGTDYRLKIYDQYNTSNVVWSDYFTIMATPPPSSISLVLKSYTYFEVSWSSVSTATTYRVDVSTSSDFSNILPAYNNYDAGGSGSGGFYVTGLTQGTTYYLRVRTVNGCGTSANSSTFTVTTDGCASIAAPTSITNGVQSYTYFELYWANVSGASTYRVDVSTTSDFSSILPAYNNLDVGGSASGGYYFTDLYPSTTYYVRVRAVRSCGSVSANSTTFTAATSYCAPIAAPVSTTTMLTSYTYFELSWPNVGSAQTYRVDVSTTSDFSSILPAYNNLDVGGSASGGFYFTGLTHSTTYYVRIRSISSCATVSPNSATFTVATAYCAIPPAPDPVTLDSKSYFNIKVQWPAIGVASSYQYDVSTNDTFTEILPAYNNATASASANTGLDITGLTDNTTYYIRIRTLNACTAVSPYSTTFSTSTPDCVPPSEPTANAATSVTAVSYVASWSNVSAPPNGYNVYTNYSGGYVVNGTSGTSLTITGLHPSTNYTYWVVAKGCINSGNSNIVSFTTQALGVPDWDDGSGDGDEFWISWDAVPYATKYYFQMSLWDDFPSNLLYYHNEFTDNETELIDYDWCTKYYLRVRAVTASGDYGAWSEVLEWGPSAGCRKAAPETEVAEAAPEKDDIALSFYPNPVQDVLHVTIPKTTDKTDLNVFTMTGQVVSVPVSLHEQEAALDISGISPGLYILQVKQNGKKQTFKFQRK